MNEEEILKALESLLFVWGSPLDVKITAEALELPVPETRDAFLKLKEIYESSNRGLMIREINGAFQLCTIPENDIYISRLCTPVRAKRLSNAALEVLAIIAYKQPVSRSEIDYIRGIKCDRVLEGLIGKDLIEEKGRGEGIGRPILYGTTSFFLEKLNISSLEELPVIEDLDILADDIEEAEAGEESGEQDFQQISLTI